MAEEQDFYCKDCGHRAPAERFGLYVQCPACKSNQIVSAELWEKFGGVHPIVKKSRNRQQK